MSRAKKPPKRMFAVFSKRGAVCGEFYTREGADQAIDIALDEGKARKGELTVHEYVLAAPKKPAKRRARR